MYVIVCWALNSKVSFCLHHRLVAKLTYSFIHLFRYHPFNINSYISFSIMVPCGVELFDIVNIFLPYLFCPYNVPKFSYIHFYFLNIFTFLHSIILFRHPFVLFILVSSSSINNLGQRWYPCDTHCYSSICQETHYLSATKKIAKFICEESLGHEIILEPLCQATNIMANIFDIHHCLRTLSH